MPIVHHGRADAAAAIWNPAGSTPSLDARRHRRRMRRRGVLRGLLGVAACVALYFWGAAIVSGVALAVGGAVLTAAIVSPTGAYARIESALAAFGVGVTRALAWVLLAPVYFLFFLPFGLLLRRGAADPLRRQFDAALPSYWIARGAAQPDYRRPF